MHLPIKCLWRAIRHLQKFFISLRIFCDGGCLFWSASIHIPQFYCGQSIVWLSFIKDGPSFLKRLDNFIFRVLGRFSSFCSYTIPAFTLPFLPTYQLFEPLLCKKKPVMMSLFVSLWWINDQILFRLNEGYQICIVIGACLEQWCEIWVAIKRWVSGSSSFLWSLFIPVCSLLFFLAEVHCPVCISRPCILDLRYIFIINPDFALSCYFSGFISLSQKKMMYVSFHLVIKMGKYYVLILGVMKGLSIFLPILAYIASFIQWCTDVFTEVTKMSLNRLGSEQQ